MRPEEITEERLAGALSLAGLPDPDLHIRTGGEHRISNFLLWQLAYAELYFTPVLWPDFGRPALEQAMAAYFARERRFGGLAQEGPEKPPAPRTRGLLPV